MRRLLSVTLMALAASASPAHAGPAKEVAVARTPADVIRVLRSGYVARSAATFEALLTADFRFHFSADDRAGASYAEGLDRATEMRVNHALFTGDPGAMMAKPDTMEVTVGTLDEGADPEHPDSTCQYRLVVAHDFVMRLGFVHHDTIDWVQAGGGLQVFHVVRGDAAVRTADQRADTTRWYARRWLEDLDALTVSLTAITGECAEDAPPPPDAAAAPPALGLRAVNAPLCPTLKVFCDLPGTEPAKLEVFDVQGRRVAIRTLSPLSPGSALIEAGDGKRFTPGVYWLRLQQGKRPAAKRMVVVAR